MISILFQYVSCGWDRTIRIWNCWVPPKPKRKTSKEKREEEMRLGEFGPRDEAGVEEAPIPEEEEEGGEAATSDGTSGKTDMDGKVIEVPVEQ